MEISVFHFQDYKAYMKAWIAAQPGRGRGEKSRLAECVKCHSAYMSQVLEGNSQLSPEQGALASTHFGHTAEERRFFILLIHHARAGNPELREVYEAQIREILDKRMRLRNRADFKRAISPENQAIYYSNWDYAAIHVLLSVPEFRTRDTIARRLHLSSTRVSEVLEFLCSIGLAKQHGDGYEIGQGNIHLGDNSPHSLRHHTNWRLQAIQSLERPSLSELHYSSVGSIAQADLPKARAILVKAIEEIRGVVRASKEDTVFCYTLDLFQI